VRLKKGGKKPKKINQVKMSFKTDMENIDWKKVNTEVTRGLSQSASSQKERDPRGGPSPPHRREEKSRRGDRQDDFKERHLKRTRGKNKAGRFILWEKKRRYQGGKGFSHKNPRDPPQEVSRPKPPEMGRQSNAQGPTQDIRKTRIQGDQGVERTKWTDHIPRGRNTIVLRGHAH